MKLNHFIINYFFPLPFRIITALKKTAENSAKKHIYENIQHTGN